MAVVRKLVTHLVSAISKEDMVMWITAVVTAAALLLPGQTGNAPITLVGSPGYNKCIYDCTLACGEVYIDSRACAEKSGCLTRASEPST